MTPAVALAAAAGLGFAPTFPAAEVGAGRPPMALSVSPARVAIVAPGSRTIRLRNSGSREVTVDAARLALGARRSANRWVTIVPTRLVLRPGASAAMTIRVVPRARAAPGDHRVLVLLVARRPAAAHVAVRMRLGVVLRIRVPGLVVRHLELGSLRVLRHGGVRVLLASVANRGNVTEELRGRITTVLVRGGHVLARLRAPARGELRPGTHAVFRARYAGRVRGRARALVIVRVGRGRRTLRREYEVRL